MSNAIVEFAPTHPQFQAARKPADQTISSQTTLQNAAGLSIPVSANEVWAFMAVLLWNSGATPDIKFGWSVPAGATMNWAPADPAPSAITESQTTSPSGAAGDSMSMHMGYITAGATPGNLQFQFAQNTSDPSSTTLKANSYIIAWRLS